MLDIHLITGKPDFVEAQLKRRHPKYGLGEIPQIWAERNKLQARIDKLRQERKKTSKQIGEKKQKGEKAEDLMETANQINDEIKASEAKISELENRAQALLLEIPNLPHSSVPAGESDKDNPVVRTWGEPRKFAFEPKPHWEIGEKLGILDLARGSKIGGTGFPATIGKGASLERAIFNFMLDLHVREHGFLEVFPPILVRREIMVGTGQLPKFEEDMYRVEKDDLFAIPTSEVPLTNLHREEIMNASDLPRYYTALTPCFRREAGSYGQDCRGIFRVHQFHKVEMVMITNPADSYEHHEKMVTFAQEVLQRLELPHRVVLLCTGDMGFSAAKTYDIEVWLPTQNRYREISSCSNCEDFQARRMSSRFRDTDGKVKFVHTLNGSGLAVGRAWIAVVENFQNEDGSVTIPKALVPYMGGVEKIG